MRKNCTNQYKILKIDTLSGGGKRDFFGQNDFMDIWVFLMKTSTKQKCDRGRDSRPPRPRLNSQPQGATKDTWEQRGLNGSERGDGGGGGFCGPGPEGGVHA